MQLAIIRYILVLVLGAVIGSTLMGWKYDKALALEQAAASDAVAKAAEEEKSKTINALEQLRAAQAEISKLDTEKYAQLEAQRSEIDRLNACVRTGTCGLRINATCPTSTARGERGSDPSAPGVDDDKVPTLTPVAESAYFALRHGINENESKLVMCQEYAGRLWERVTKLQQPEHAAKP